jgi:predicted AAA+ superfamily ATPase
MSPSTPITAADFLFPATPALNAMIADTTQALLQQLLLRADTLIAHLQTTHQHQLLIEPDWSVSIAFRYRRTRAGGAQLMPVAHVAPMALDDLQEIEDQKEKIRRNTEHFMKGLPANNVLLTGARGTGKSSLIKACLHAYAAHGLRLIEVDKNDLVDLPDIVDLVANRDERFIVYCDDLSFEDGDPAYKALKSILDGSIAASGANVLVYATSNRRHLLPEYMSENLSYKHTPDGEVHPGEGVEEKISLSERFGLWVSFYPFSQDEYIVIVNQWLQHFVGQQVDVETAKPHALLWALERGSRSGRVAYQFARDYASLQHDLKSSVRDST